MRSKKWTYAAIPHGDDISAFLLWAGEQSFLSSRDHLWFFITASRDKTSKWDAQHALDRRAGSR